MRPRNLLTATVIGLAGFAGCTGVSRNPLDHGRGNPGGTGAASGAGGVTAGAGSPDDAQSGADSAGEGGGNGGSGRVSGGNGGRGGNDGTGGASGGNGGNAAPGGEGGVNGGEGGVNAGEGGATAGEAGSGGEGGGAPVFRRCSSGQPFGTPRRSGLPNGCTRLRLNPDETVGYYGCRQPGRYDIMVATRPNRGVPFDEASATVIHTDPGGDHDYLNPTVTADGLVLYFENEPGSDWSKIYRSVWNPEQGAFGPAELVPGLGSPSYGDYSPYVIPSGGALYFHSGRAYPYDQIYRAAWDGGSFSAPELIDLPGSRGYPVVSPDELTIYYTRNLAGGALTADIWQVTRTTTSQSFELFEPTLVQGPNEGEYTDLASFVSEDGCRLYFDRNFPGPDTNSYVVERTPDLEGPENVAGTGNTAGTAGTGTAGTGNAAGTAGTGNDGGMNGQGGAGSGGTGAGGEAAAGGNGGDICSEGNTQSCYTGPAETRNVGLCLDGIRTCTGGVWGACAGEVTPTPDVCNGYDDDCNAATADGSQDPTSGQRCDGSDSDLCNEGTRGCANGSYTCSDDTSSTPESCSGDRVDEDCNGWYDEGFNENVNPICAGAIDLGNLAGDSGAEVVTDAHYEERWYRFTLSEDQNDGSGYLSATIRLHSAFGTDYDLYVYCANCGGSPTRFSAIGGLAHDDIVRVRMNDEPGIDDSAVIIVEIRYYNSSRCAYWGLEVTGNTTVTETTCP